MKSEHVEWNEGNHREESGDKQEHYDFVLERLSLLHGRFEAFRKQFFASAVEADCAQTRANENNCQKHPSTPPIQSPSWQEQQETEDGHVGEDADGQFENGHRSFPLP
jgi:hypothetical protein